jgi:hypothetical protein
MTAAHMATAGLTEEDLRLLVHRWLKPCRRCREYFPVDRLRPVADAPAGEGVCAACSAARARDEKSESRDLAAEWLLWWA